jgi:hypothetical protein
MTFRLTAPGSFSCRGAPWFMICLKLKERKQSQLMWDFLLAQYQLKQQVRLWDFFCSDDYFVKQLEDQMTISTKTVTMF